MSWIRHCGWHFAQSCFQTLTTWHPMKIDGAWRECPGEAWLFPAERWKSKIGETLVSTRHCTWHSPQSWPRTLTIDQRGSCGVASCCSCCYSQVAFNLTRPANLCARDCGCLICDGCREKLSSKRSPGPYCLCNTT